MCQHRSYIVLETAKVLSLIDNDSHADIAEKHHLRDTALNQSRHCSIEMIPDRLHDCSGWKLIFDDAKPDWWSEHHEKELRRQLARDHAVFWKDGEYKFGGDLNLISLTSLPADAKLSAGGDLDLRSDLKSEWLKRQEAA